MRAKSDSRRSIQSLYRLHPPDSHTFKCACIHRINAADCIRSLQWTRCTPRATTFLVTCPSRSEGGNHRTSSIPQEIINKHIIPSYTNLSGFRDCKLIPIRFNLMNPFLKILPSRLLLLGIQIGSCPIYFERGYIEAKLNGRIPESEINQIKWNLSKPPFTIYVQCSYFRDP